MKNTQLRKTLHRAYFMRGFLTGLFFCATFYGYAHGDWVAVGGATLVTFFMVTAVYGETDVTRTKKD